MSPPNRCGRLLIKRVIQAYDSGELLEAIGAPFDTYEEEVK
jgi:hypothetical protein